MEVVENGGFYTKTTFPNTSWAADKLIVHGRARLTKAGAHHKRYTGEEQEVFNVERGCRIQGPEAGFDPRGGLDLAHGARSGNSKERDHGASASENGASERHARPSQTPFSPAGDCRMPSQQKTVLGSPFSLA